MKNLLVTMVGTILNVEVVDNVPEQSKYVMSHPDGVDIYLSPGTLYPLSQVKDSKTFNYLVDKGLLLIRNLRDNPPAAL